MAGPFQLHYKGDSTHTPLIPPPPNWAQFTISCLALIFEMSEQINIQNGKLKQNKQALLHILVDPPDGRLGTTRLCFEMTLFNETDLTSVPMLMYSNRGLHYTVGCNAPSFFFL